jgi:hypothetical protein
MIKQNISGWSHKTILKNIYILKNKYFYELIRLYSLEGWIWSPKRSLGILHEGDKVKYNESKKR